MSAVSNRRGSAAAILLSVQTRELSHAFSASKKTAYDDAETALREAYEHLVKERGAFDTHSLAMLHTYAELVKVQDLREGSELLEECQRGCITTYGAEHDVSLGIMMSLADTYVEMGKAEDALWLYRTIYKHRCNRDGVNHPETLICTDKLAAGYAKLGNYSRAEQLLVAHLAVLEAQWGSERTSTIDAVYRLADLYVQQGRYAETEPLLRECLATYERLVGVRHPDYLRGLFTLGNLYVCCDQHADALPCLEISLVARSDSLGVDHADTAASVELLTSVYEALGLDAQALRLLEESYYQCKEAKGEEHPSTLRAMHALAALLCRQGQGIPSLDMLTRCLELTTQQLGDSHLQTLETKFALGQLCDAIGCVDQATPLYAACLVGRRQRLGGDHDLTLHTMRALASAHSRSLRGRERVMAVPLYEEYIATLSHRLHCMQLDPDQPALDRPSVSPHHNAHYHQLHTDLEHCTTALRDLKRSLAAVHSGPWPKPRRSPSNVTLETLSSEASMGSGQSLPPSVRSASAWSTSFPHHRRDTWNAKKYAMINFLGAQGALLHPSELVTTPGSFQLSESSSASASGSGAGHSASVHANDDAQSEAALSTAAGTHSLSPLRSWVAQIPSPKPRSKAKARARLPVNAFMRGTDFSWKDILKQI